MSKSEVKLDDPEFREPKSMYRGFWFEFPRINAAGVRDLMERLGAPYDEEACKLGIREYRWRRFMATFKTVAVVLLLASYIGPLVDKWSTPAWRSIPPEQFFREEMPGIGFLAGVALAVFLIWRWSRASARTRFFRNIGKAIHELPRNDGDRSEDNFELIPLLNRLGTAARALFLVLQGSHRTWRAPPMVADRATTLAATLIDFDIDGDMHRQDATALAMLRRFLQDFAVVVAIGREDLLREVRDLHSKPFPRRQDEEKRERDVRYLNEMRNRNRWDVVKDFWYPLAPWFSLLVAIAALVVSIVHP